MASESISMEIMKRERPQKYFWGLQTYETQSRRQATVKYLPGKQAILSLLAVSSTKAQSPDFSFASRIYLLLHPLKILFF